jgi:hypothetical protein
MSNLKKLKNAALTGSASMTEPTPKSKQQSILQIRQRYPSADAGILNLVRMIEEAAADGNPMPRSVAINGIGWIHSAFADPRTRVEEQQILINEQHLNEQAAGGFAMVTEEGVVYISGNTQRKLDEALKKVSDGQFQFLKTCHD